MRYRVRHAGHSRQWRMRSLIGSYQNKPIDPATLDVSGRGSPDICRPLVTLQTRETRCSVFLRTENSFLQPLLELRPKLFQRTEFRSLADVDIDIAFESVRIISRAYIFHMLEFLFQDFFFIIEHDHAITRIASRTPE